MVRERPLTIVHAYSGNRFGGVEMQLLYFQWHRSLSPGLAPAFVLCFDGLLARKLRHAEARLHVVNEVSFRRPWTVWRARRAHARVFRDMRPDVVVCHEFWSYALVAPVARRFRLPTVMWHHSPPSGYRQERGVARHPPDLALASSRYVASTLTALAPPGRVRVSPYCVDPPEPGAASKRAAIRHALGVQPGEVVIFHAARLSRYKGQRELLDAAGSLKDLPVRVWMAGGPQDGDEEMFLSDLQALCRTTGIAAMVSFLGHRDDVRDLYFAADIFCQPNPTPEPFGMTFVEALYAGLPVVGTDIGGAREILWDQPTGERFGVLVPPRDRDALVRALRPLVERPDERSRFAAIGPARARALSDPAMAFARFEQLMREAIQLHERGLP